MTPAQLKAEILTGPLAAPLAAAWAAGNDTEVARLLSAKRYPWFVPIRELSAYCVTRGITGSVLALDTIPIGGDLAPGVPMTLQTKGLLKTVITLVQDDYRLQEADVTGAAFQQAMAGLVSLDVMTTAQKDEIVALADNRASRADVLGWSITPDAVGLARREG